MKSFLKMESEPQDKRELNRALIACIPSNTSRKLLAFSGEIIKDSRDNIGENHTADALQGEEGTNDPTDGIWVWEGYPYYWSEYDAWNGDYDGGCEFVGKWRRPTKEEWEYYCNDETVWLSKQSIMDPC